jgi:hypothetical protein
LIPWKATETWSIMISLTDVMDIFSIVMLGHKYLRCVLQKTATGAKQVTDVLYFVLSLLCVAVVTIWGEQFCPSPSLSMSDGMWTAQVSCGNASGNAMKACSNETWLVPPRPPNRRDQDDGRWLVPYADMPFWLPGYSTVIENPLGWLRWCCSWKIYYLGNLWGINI